MKIKNHSAKTQSPMGNISSQLESTNIKLQNHTHEFLVQDPHNQGFKSTLRSYYIPKIYIRKFDGSDLVTWIFQREQYFDLHQAESLQKVNIASMFL